MQKFTIGLGDDAIFYFVGENREKLASGLSNGVSATAPPGTATARLPRASHLPNLAAAQVGRVLRA